MIKIKKPRIGQAVRTEMTLAGTSFEIELIPTSEIEMGKIFDPFRKTASKYNPVSKKMDLVPYLDEKNIDYIKIAEDLLDQKVVNFWGIGDETGNILDGSLRENKLLLGSILVEDIEDIEIIDEETGEKAVIRQPRKRFFRNLIFNKVAELSNAIAEADTKN